jgi:hypothetical protein
MVSALVFLVVIAICAGLAYYIVDVIGVPEPLNRFIKLAIIVICALAVIILLLDMAGMNTGFIARH